MKRKKAKPKKAELPHGYLCAECAEAKGLKWPEGHCATSHYDECPYCREIKGLTSVTDWLRPGQKELKSWD
jgi:hypothetical protein